MGEPELAIRAMTEEELALPLQWAAEEGWNPGIGDARPFHAADPDGFLMAFLDGEPAGSISVVRYGEDFGFLGLYIVRPALRGRGIGMRLWRAGLNHLGGRMVGLDGVVAQQENYARSGFRLAYRTIRYSGRARLVTSDEAEPCVVPVGRTLLEPVIAYDRRHFPADRAGFLSRWLLEDQRTALAAVIGGSVRGYAVRRACTDGFKIGPLMADTPELAANLFRAAVTSVAGETVVLDAPEPNRHAQALALRHGLEPIFESARMYNGPAPDLPLATLYGTTTLELG